MSIYMVIINLGTGRLHMVTRMLACGLCLALIGCGPTTPTVDLLNVSYDPTRELYRTINRMFIEHHRAETGMAIRIRQSHGGSGSQARAVIDGLPADIVTLGMWTDTDAIRKQGLISDVNWTARLENRSLPYYSTIVFVVRKGNPKGIHDWPDLSREGIQVIPANPKTGGGARLNLLAAWGAIKDRGGSDAEAMTFITGMYRNAPVLDSGARSAAITFARKNIGDVQLAWENEAYLEKRELGDEVEIVYPSVSIYAEPYVAWVDDVIDRKGTRAVAESYLRYLYTPEAQKVIAENYYRPIHPDVVAQYQDQFPTIRLLRIEEIAGSWAAAQERFFAEGGIFDQIYTPRSEH